MGRGLICQRSRRSFPACHLCDWHRIGHYHMFPCAIPVCQVDYPRLKRAASVRSEPGSNSPLFNFLCTEVHKLLYLTFRLSCHFSHEPALYFRSYFSKLTEASSFSISLPFAYIPGLSTIFSLNFDFFLNFLLSHCRLRK